MNLLIQSTAPLTMSTREIASLIGSKHDSVLKAVRNLAEKGLVSASETPYTHEQNKQTYYEYLLNNRDTLLLVSGYSAELRARIIDRWQELESAQKPMLPDFTNPAEAARAWADEVEAKQKAQKELLTQKPKIEFVDNYVDVGTTKTLRETAKITGFPERKLISRLIEDKVLYRQSGNLLPHQKHHEAGRFSVKTGERNGYAYTQTRVTTTGIQWIAQRYASELMEDK